MDRTRQGHSAEGLSLLIIPAMPGIEEICYAMLNSFVMPWLGLVQPPSEAQDDWLAAPRVFGIYAF